VSILPPSSRVINHSPERKLKQPVHFYSAISEKINRLTGTFSLRRSHLDLDEEDYHDFDHYTIVKIEPGELWLQVYDIGGVKTLGPIPFRKRRPVCFRRAGT